MIERKYNRQYLSNVQKHEKMQEIHRKFLSTANLHTKCHFKNINLKVDLHTGPTFIKQDQLDPRIKDQVLLNNFAPTVTEFCVMWEGQALPRDTKFGNCRGEIVDMGAFPSWSLIHGSSWSGLIKVDPGGKWFIHGHNHCKENQSQSPKQSYWISFCM